MEKTHLLVALFLSAFFTIAAAKSRELQEARSEQCDLFRGEWICSPSDPPYSEGCRFIQNLQNCLKNGRPDREYLHWRWKAYGCKLPQFEPEQFLITMSDKYFAFVGDSIIRNQMESLMCLLSTVEDPLLIYLDGSSKHSATWYFPSYNFTLAMLWSPFLLRQEDEERDGIQQLHADVLDRDWTDPYHDFDYVLISTSSWFNRPLYLLENNTVIGCYGCATTDASGLGPLYPYRLALGLAFDFFLASEHKPFVIYRIHSPAHFEHGNWKTGGYCNRTEPFEEGDPDKFRVAEDNREFERIGREEYAKAAAVIGENGTRLEMLDMYHLSLLRPDGHPDAYRGDEKHDCVHWCTPGVIDTWNDLLMEMIMRDKDRSGTSVKDGGHVI